MSKQPAKRKALFPSPTNVKFPQFIARIQRFANNHDELELEIREAKGSHTVIKFMLEDHKWRFTIPRPHGGNNKILPVYIRKINRIIWEIEDIITSLDTTNKEDSNGDDPQP